MLERDIKNYLVRRCKELMIYHRKFTSPGRVSVLDWILANNGKVVFLELKAPGKHPTAAQQREIDRLTEAGVYATCASSYAEIEFVLSYLME
jgi:hypothetical protein